MAPEITTERGVVIRSLTQVKADNYTRGYSYTFQALLNGEWYWCSGPCGDWSLVGGRAADDKSEPPQFSVSVGWWELDDIFYKRGRYAQ